MFSTRFGRGPRRKESDSGAGPAAGPAGATSRAAGALPKGLRDRFTEGDLPSAAMQATYRYWQECRHDGGLPPVGAIDPTRLPRACLPLMALLDVERPSLRFRTRLTGTGVVEALGTDHTGLYLDQIPGMAEQIERIAWCAETRRPYLSEAQVSFAPHTYRRYHVLTLPFGDNAVGVQRILFMFFFAQSSGG